MEEWSTLCRCCLATGSTSLIRNDEVQTKFHEITSIDVKEDDGLPQQLCHDCLSIMNSAHQFKKQCLRIDMELKMQLAEINNLVPQAEEAPLPEPPPIIEVPEQHEVQNADPIVFPNVVIKSERPDQATESDDDCYYVLVIDEESSKEKELPKIKDEPKELNPSTGELEFENSVDAFLVKNPQERISNEQFEVPLFANDGASYRFIEDPDTNDSEDQSQLQLTANLDIEDADALLSGQNGNLIKLLTGKGGGENLLFKSETGNEYVTYIVNNQLVGDSEGQEGEVIVCEGDVCDSEDAQFEIVNCEGSELVIEYADDGQISSTVMRQNNGAILCPCGEKFTDYAQFESHQILNQCGDMAAESHLCSLCGKGFESHEILTGHMLLHTNSSVNIICPYCEQAVKRNSITQHIKYSHNNIKPRCSVCDKTFANPNNLKRHMMIHSGVRQFECDICSKRFHQKITMQTHRLTHLADPLFCSLCEVHFETESQLAAHREQHECKSATESLEVRSLKGKALCYTCNICSKMFSVESALKYHIDNVHVSEPPTELLCSECGEILPNRKAMYTHASMHQPELGIRMKVERRFECSVCHKTCSSQAMLIMHERVHTNERPFPCPLCALRFKTKTHLRTHQLTHTREKRFGCSICMKFFALKGNLVVHLRTHTGERPYVCSLCNEAFIDSKYLKKHKMRKHAISNVPWNKY